MKSRIAILCMVVMSAPFAAQSQPSQTPPQGPAAGSGSGSGPQWTAGVQDVTADELGTPGRVTLSMERAVELAVKQHPTMRIQRATAEAAFGRVDQARVVEHPTVTLAGTLGAQSSFAGGGGSISGGTYTGQFFSNEATSGLSASASWRIYDFGQTRANVAAAVANADAAVAGAASSALDVRLNVETAYLQAIATRRLVIVAEATVKSEEGHTDQAKRFVAAGQYDPIQVSQAQSRLANARSALAQSQSNEAAALSTLRAAIGWLDPTRSPAVDPKWPVPSSQDPQDLAQLVEIARSNRPDIIQLDKQIIASDLSLEAAHAERRPILSATASTSWNLNSNDFRFSCSCSTQVPGAPQPTWIAGLTLSWLAWDGGKSAADVHVARGTLDIALANRDELLLTLTSTLESSRTQIITNKANVAASAEAVSAAQDQLKLSDARYAHGLGSQIELADAQTAVTTAAGNLVSAEWQLATAWATLERALGQQ